MNEDHEDYDLTSIFDEREASLQSLDWESKQRVHEAIAAIQESICSFEQIIQHVWESKHKLESQIQELHNIISPS